tara:strand:- start:3139 stop:4974 length:1836 start_codon:yes stop_codon:yes gene_type:complete
MKKIILSSYDEELNDRLFPVYYWNGFKQSKYYINDYIEKNKIEIRNKYLSFIENIDTKYNNNNKIKAIFGVDNFHSLWEMSSIYEKCPNKSLVINDCIKLIALEEILIIEKPDIVKLISNDTKIYKSIKNLCEENNIKLQYDLSLLYFSNYRPKSLIPNIIKTTYFIFKTFLSCFFSKNNAIKNNFGSQISLISHFLNYKIHKNENDKVSLFSNYWHNLPDLIYQRKQKINWLHLGIDNKANKSFNNLKKENANLDNATTSHILIDSNLSFDIFFTSIIIFLRISLISLFTFNIKELFELKNSNINFYSLLRADWITSTRGPQLFYSIITIKTFDKLFSKLQKQKLGLYLFENQSWERALIGSWRKFDHGKLIGIDHTTGYMRFWDLRYYKSLNFYKNSYIKPDLRCISSPLSKEMMICSGFPKDKVIDVEALRFNYLIKNISDFNSQKLGSNNVLLIGDIDYVSTKNLLEDINKIHSDINKEFKICFRPHPGTPNKGKLINFAKNLNIDISNSSLISDIKFYDKIIIVGASSVSIEALLMKKKIIVYLSKDKLNLSPVNYIKKINFISSSQDLLNSINFEIKNVKVEQEFFWLDNDLCKWKIFLDSQLKY